MKKSRYLQTARDMTLSMGVVGAIVALILIITWRPHSQVMQQTDYSVALTMANEQSPFAVMSLAEVPAGYQITNARFEQESYGQPGQVRWFISYVDAQGNYISFWQSSGPAKKVIAAATNGGECSETLTVAKRDWQRCETSKPLTRSLVTKNEEFVAVVSGTAPWETLEWFASSLN